MFVSAMKLEFLLSSPKYVERVVLLGDFNLPNSDWGVECLQFRDPRCQAVADLADLFHQTQVIKLKLLEMIM